MLMPKMLFPKYSYYFFLINIKFNPRYFKSRFICAYGLN